MAKDSTARISFNCKISQEIAIKLESVECRSRSNENQEIGSEHAFSFVAIV